MDNASWHKRKTTNWHNWQPMYLPPYSPDLNPIERIWLTMKARWFNNHVCKNEEKLFERFFIQPLMPPFRISELIFKSSIKLDHGYYAS